jgi:SAM-dependent methyltransferase
MGREIDLLVNYPKSIRDVSVRGLEKTENDRAIASCFGAEYFDGERRHGYGGFKYSPRFWQPVVPTMQKHFALLPSSSVLDVGCAKGFMLHDLSKLIPGITVKGIDISQYAIANSIDDMKQNIQFGDAKCLPFADDSFDVVISITTLHNLDRNGCAKALREIERVSRGKSFITVDAYRTTEEKSRMSDWNLTAKTVMHVDEWKVFFDQNGYTGDYYWFTP